MSWNLKDTHNLLYLHFLNLKHITNMKIFKVFQCYKYKIPIHTKTNLFKCLKSRYKSKDEITEQFLRVKNHNFLISKLNWTCKYFKSLNNHVQLIMIIHSPSIILDGRLDKIFEIDYLLLFLRGLKYL